MPYVQRINGKVVGKYTNPQEGYAEEWLDDGHPDLLPSESDLALQAIFDLETQQTRVLTPRALREFMLVVMNQLGGRSLPAFAALKAIDDQIRVRRAKL